MGKAMAHRADVERYPGSLVNLAADLASLRYDALAVFLAALAGRLEADAAVDDGRGRVRLAAELRAAASGVATAAGATERAWRICEPHM
jgi:hypothetical protein